ncbi:MAG: sigma-70 family RNA polymerase sigma factor [Planctomycetota bacterium]
MLPDQGKTDADRTPDELPVQVEDRVLVECFLEARGENPAEPRAPAEMESAFRMLLVRYQERIHKLVFRYTKDPLEAEDVTQEVFLKLYRKLDGFQWDSAFYTWLYRIAVNTAVDYMGKTRRRPVQLSGDVTELGGRPDGETASSPDAALLRQERAMVTHRILEELPEPYRTVLTLREFEDLSYLEIAEVLGCSLGTVESRLFRARARFRRILEERYPELLA